jgi:hypothetical protein
MHKRYSDLEPISKYTFRKRIHTMLLLQMIYAAFVFILANQLDFYSFGKNLFITLALMLITVLLIMISISDFDTFRSRFKALYPETTFPYYVWLIMLFFPFVFWAILIFLYFKEPNKITTNALSFKYLPVGMLPILCIQFVLPVSSLYLSSPSMHFALDSYDTLITVLKYKNEIKSSKNLYSDYSILKPGKLNSTELVFLISAGVLTIKKNNKNSDAYSSFEALTNLTYETLIESEKSKVSFFDYSLTQWLHPTGAIEIFILERLDKSILYQLSNTLIKKNAEILARTEKKLNRLPASQRSKFEDKINSQKTLFLESKTMKSILFKKNENSFPVK